MKVFELDYIEKNGILYPDIQISNDKSADERPIGKYGMMWLQFMKEQYHDEYIHHIMDGNLFEMAHKINDEAYEMIKSMIGKSKDSMIRIIAEEIVIKEFVLTLK